MGNKLAGVCEDLALEKLQEWDRNWAQACFRVSNNPWENGILTGNAAKKSWGDRVTIVFPRQGNFANDPKIVAAYPAADLTIEHIGDLLNYDFTDIPKKPYGAASIGFH